MLQTEISADTRSIADLLIACPVGEMVTLAAMSEALGRDITACRHIAASARRIAQRECGAVFTTERGRGLRRLSPERVIETIGPAARTHIRRTARRARRTLLAGTAGTNSLPAEAQRRLAMEASVLGLMEHIARDSTATAKPTSPTKPMAVAVTARMLLSTITGSADDA